MSEELSIAEQLKQRKLRLQNNTSNTNNEVKENEAQNQSNIIEPKENTPNLNQNNSKQLSDIQLLQNQIKDKEVEFNKLKDELDALKQKLSQLTSNQFQNNNNNHNNNNNNNNKSQEEIDREIALQLQRNFDQENDNEDINNNNNNNNNNGNQNPNNLHPSSQPIHPFLRHQNYNNDLRGHILNLNQNRNQFGSSPFGPSSFFQDFDSIFSQMHGGGNDGHGHGTNIIFHSSHHNNNGDDNNQDDDNNNNNNNNNNNIFHHFSTFDNINDNNNIHSNLNHGDLFRALFSLSGNPVDIDHMSFEQLSNLFPTIPRRANEETIQNLPVESFKSKKEDHNNNNNNNNNNNEEQKKEEVINKESQSCSICLETFKDGDTIRRLPCFHIFHQSEIDKWLRTNHVCPICRSPVEQNQ